MHNNCNLLHAACYYAQAWLLFSLCIREYCCISPVSRRGIRTVGRGTTSSTTVKAIVCGLWWSLTFTNFRKLYDIKWSDTGSNHRNYEEDTIFAWEVCLQKCGGTKVLAYIFICAQCIGSNKPSLAVQNSWMSCSILFIVGHHDLLVNLVISSIGRVKPKTQHMT